MSLKAHRTCNGHGHLLCLSAYFFRMSSRNSEHTIMLCVVAFLRSNPHAFFAHQPSVMNVRIFLRWKPPWALTQGSFSFYIFYYTTSFPNYVLIAGLEPNVHCTLDYPTKPYAPQTTERNIQFPVFEIVIKETEAKLGYSDWRPGPVLCTSMSSAYCHSRCEM